MTGPAGSLASAARGHRWEAAQSSLWGEAKRGSRQINRLLSENHPQQAYKRDQRRGRGPHLNNAVGHANRETHEEGDKVADHGAPLFLRPQHDAASRARCDLAVGLLRLAEPASLGDGRGTVVTRDKPRG
jgi:hypothetical protein